MKKSTTTIEVPVHQHDNVAFKARAQSMDVDGEHVECHLRQPGNDPAIHVKGKWYVIRLKDIAHALIEQLKHNTKESE